MSKEAVIPQAHSYAFFEKVILAAQKKGMDQDALAKKFDVQRRTISYYVQLGRWIEFLGEEELSAKGNAFVEASKKERIELFKTAITGFDWVKNASDEGGTTEAFDKEIAKVSDLADSTRRRRARAMSKLWISVIEADGTRKKTFKKKKTTKKAAPKKAATKKTSTKKKPTAKKTETKKAAAKKKASVKKAPKKPAQPKKAASKKAATKSAKKTTPKAKTPKKAAPKKAATKKAASTSSPKKEYTYSPPAPNKAPDHPLVWVGKKVVKGAFKAAGKVLRFL